MAEMTPLFTLFAIFPILLTGFIIYVHQRTYGVLEISTTSVAYDRLQYQDVLDWDKYALTIEGEPTMLFSAEFHYWRVPDRERWPTILKEYRSMGMNAIRVYFHWGYHSPEEGRYNFEGNRDIDYLLSLCEELGLYVLAAPGPYICAETQAGGYPGWLIAKRELRIRHAKLMLWRTYDENFAQYEIQWLNNVLPIIAKHQITAKDKNKKGCVIALQIDNELFERMALVLPIGLRDQMRVLAKAARDAGITVPFFSNDGFEESSWVPRPHLDNRPRAGFWSSTPFGLDLYGFDKYVVFAPSSAPTSWLFDTGNSTHAWKEWNPKSIERSMDGLEKTVRGFGGGAKESPMFIPELQGGWFNHYQLQHTYDQIYDFYGHNYTTIMLESSLAQGVTMANLYMTYGGTNWGTLGDPDVYTSYDYSACIREYGYLSTRGRNLRKTILFARSFDPYFTKTEKLFPRQVKSSVKYTINRQRVAVGADQDVTFTFFRNFDRKRRDLFDVRVETSGGNFTMSCYLPYKTSFIGVGNYKAANGMRMLQATVPIHARLVDKERREEIWFVEPNHFGGLAFEPKEVEITGNMQDDILRKDGPADILRFEKKDGWTKLKTTTGVLYIIGLNAEDASTLYADFEEAYWNKGKKQYPAFVAWGANSFYYNRHDNTLEINYRKSDSRVHVVSFHAPSDPRLAREKTMGVYKDMPYVYTMDFNKHAHQQFPLPVQIDLKEWKSRPVDFPSLPWQPLKRLSDDAAAPPTFDALDYHYLSGHILYRTTFSSPNPTSARRVKLSLNMRHRATVLLNNRVVGGHTTYSRQLFSAGGKIGPDPWFLGTKTYDLTPYLYAAGNNDTETEGIPNELVILVDSFGLNRQAFIMNDVRNPRGIIKVHLSGVEQQGPWQITGVDVRDLDIPYNSTGFPDERVDDDEWKSMEDGSGMVEKDRHTYRFSVSTTQGAQWYEFRFDEFRKSAAESFTVPLRLHLNGPFTAQVLLNDVFIARYYGNGDSPQHDFYLPDGLVKQRSNVVRMLVYSWEDTTAEIAIAGWPVQPDSGNLITDQHHYSIYVPGSSSSSSSVQEQRPQEFMLWKETLRI